MNSSQRAKVPLPTKSKITTNQPNNQINKSARRGGPRPGYRGDTSPAPSRWLFCLSCTGSQQLTRSCPAIPRPLLGFRANFLAKCSHLSHRGKGTNLSRSQTPRWLCLPDPVLCNIAEWLGLPCDRAPQGPRDHQTRQRPPD